jgi:hypothetical protein
MSLPLEQGIDWMRRAARETNADGNKMMFVGNGGSAEPLGEKRRAAGNGV